MNSAGLGAAAVWRRLCPSAAVLATLLLEPFKAFVIAAAVFVPFERLAAAPRPALFTESTV